MLSEYPEPPTEATLQQARRQLDSQQGSLSNVTQKIDEAELALAQIIADSKCAINEMRRERSVLKEKVAQTMAYIAPIRRLPHELLRNLFMFQFEDDPCCAWGLSAVCTLWRRLSLSMPKLWSKIRLVTSQNDSADTIRLWLERSGDTIPLDIEMYLRVPGSASTLEPIRVRSVSPSPWAGSAPTTYVVAHIGSMGTPTSITHSTTPIMIPNSPSHDPWGSPPHSASHLAGPATPNVHWGYIAIYYLVAQMHRWQRFVFRFDKQFASMQALKSIHGDAPILEEFEVSSDEPVSQVSDFSWFPCAPANTSMVLPKLTTLTMRYMPFKWASPIFKANLKSLTLSALPSLSQLPIDRILHIVANLPALEQLSLHFSSVQPPVLPLANVTMHELKELSVGGHHLMTLLVESLKLPLVESLILDIEAREPVDDLITNLLTRSGSPPVTQLALAYGATPFYYAHMGAVSSWAFLADLHSLESLQVGFTPFEPLLTALGAPDEDQTTWLCPNLKSVSMRHCHSHNEGIGKLVQMVDARNPGPSVSTISVNGVTPTKLKQLELYDCASLGYDVVEWLKGRVEDVSFTEPLHDRNLFMRAGI